MSAPFAQITKGPGSQDGTNGSAPALGLDRQNNIAYSVGDDHTEKIFHCALAVLQAQAALTAITTAQNFFSKTLNANLLNRVGRKLKIKGYANYTTPGSSTPTLTMTLKLGTVTLMTITTAATDTAGVTAGPIYFEFDLVVAAAGATATLETHGTVKVGLTATTTAAIAQYLDVNNGTTNTITVGTNPAVGDTITINGTLITFIVNGGTPAGNQVALGVTAAATATALQTFLTATTSDAGLAKALYTNPSSGVVLATSITTGFTPTMATSVPAKITSVSQAVDTTVSKALAVTIAASGAGISSAQLRMAAIEVVA